MEQAHTGGVSRAAVGRSRAESCTRQARSSRATNIRPRYFLSGALVILLVAFVVRTWNLGTASLWTDEGLTALRAQATLAESLDSILSSGNQTPLYFMFLRLMPNTSEMLLRLPSALFGLLGVALTMFVGARLYRDYELALWAGGLLAVNPYHVWLSRTARPYALIFVLSLLISYLFMQLIRGRRTLGVWAALGALSMVAYITHYTMLALPAAQLMLFIFLFRHERRLFVQWAGVQAMACVPVLVWVVALLGHPVPVGPAWVPTPGLRDIPLTLWAMTTGYDGLLEWYYFPALMVVSLGLSFGLYGAVRDWCRSHLNFHWFWVISLPLVVTFVISAFIISFYVDRYFMVFLPGLLFVLAYAIRRAPRLLAQVGFATIILTGVYNIAFNFHTGSYQRADYRGAAEFIAREYKPGDALVIERTNVEEVFMRYFTPRSKEDGDPEIVLLSETNDTSPYETAGRRVWVVYRNPIEDIHRQVAMPDFNSFQAGLSPTGDWLVSRRDNVLRERKFNGVTVLELQMGDRIVAGGAFSVPARP